MQETKEKDKITTQHRTQNKTQDFVPTKNTLPFLVQIMSFLVFPSDLCYDYWVSCLAERSARKH